MVRVEDAEGGVFNFFCQFGATGVFLVAGMPQGTVCVRVSYQDCLAAGEEVLQGRLVTLRTAAGGRDVVVDDVQFNFVHLDVDSLDFSRAVVLLIYVHGVEVDSFVNEGHESATSLTTIPSDGSIARELRRLVPFL